MNQVRFHRSARAELEQAVDYYERHRSGLGLDLQNEVEAAVRRIQQNPTIQGSWQSLRDCRNKCRR